MKSRTNEYIHMLQKGHSIGQVARHFGVHYGTVCNLTWKYIHDKKKQLTRGETHD